MIIIVFMIVVNSNSVVNLKGIMKWFIIRMFIGFIVLKFVGFLVLMMLCLVLRCLLVRMGGIIIGLE